MKNTKMNKLSVVAAVILNMGALSVANAQIVPKQPVIGYPGLFFPQPMENQKSVSSLDNLLSDQITSGQAKEKDNVSEIRKEALREIASSLGASSGLAFRMNQLKNETD